MAKKTALNNEKVYLKEDTTIRESNDGLYHYEIAFYKECSRSYSLEHSILEKKDKAEKNKISRVKYPDDPNCNMVTVKTMVSAPIHYIVKNKYLPLDKPNA